MLIGLFLIYLATAVLGASSNTVMAAMEHHPGLTDLFNWVLVLGIMFLLAKEENIDG